ncbi:hypothetical protein TNCV_2822651 [Trichonephila clavipes]|nr:hypothetical protein TNCV_2822651 [Trichonephila clavipes]
MYRNPVTSQYILDFKKCPIEAPWPFFQQYNAKPHPSRVAMNCLTACQTLLWLARFLSNRAYLEYDGKAAVSIRECG